MTCDPNDPRLTAFVLGELDPSEHADVETMLGESADCRQAVEEIRLTVGWLTSRLHDEIKSHAQPANLNHPPLVASLPVTDGARAPWWHRNRFRFLGIAASLLLFAPVAYLALVPQARMDQELPKELALGSAPGVAKSVAQSPQVAFRSEPAADSFAVGMGAAMTDGTSATGEGLPASLPPRSAKFKQIAPAAPEPPREVRRFGKRVDLADASLPPPGIDAQQEAVQYSFAQTHVLPRGLPKRPPPMPRRQSPSAASASMLARGESQQQLAQSQQQLAQSSTAGRRGGPHLNQALNDSNSNAQQSIAIPSQNARGNQKLGETESKAPQEMLANKDNAKPAATGLSVGRRHCR